MSAEEKESKPDIPKITSFAGESSSDDFDLSVPKMEEVQGSKLGNKRVRIVRENNPAFQHITRGVLEATPATEQPDGGALAHVGYGIKWALIGHPIPSTQDAQERLTKFKALAVLSSDAISSVAYATEAILVNLIAAGSQHLSVAFPISLVIIALMAIVGISYRQTIPAYPNGGGSYIVASSNLGMWPGLVAAAALLIDYVLNVAVSVAAGVHNLVALFSGLSHYVVLIDILLVIFITVVNLRGIRESGTFFAIPTHFFIVTAFIMIIVGVIKAFVVGHQPLIGHFAYAQELEPLSFFLILRAFATGCSAMTGVEAISNGVPAFKKPEARNAKITLTWMMGILMALFFGITVLTMTFHVAPNSSGSPTLIALVAQQVFTGPLVFMYPVFLIATLGILTLSAETSYSDFPRLASLLARDRFLPSQFALRGERLAFSVGIVCLALLAILLLVVFGGDTNKLINLFAIGVFISFTLSQCGMVMHWWRLRGQNRHWSYSMAINGVGALTTALVALIVSTTKFVEGAWIVLLMIPLLVFLFHGIHSHYRHFEAAKTTDIPANPQKIRHRLIVPISHLDRAAIQSIAYARSISPEVTAVHVSLNDEESQQIQDSWNTWQHEHLSEEEATHLLIIESPYRALLNPLLAYIDTLQKRHPGDTITVILPEFVVAHWWEYFLHNQVALRLKARLFFRPGIVVANVPQHLMDRPLKKKALYG
jgi:amino acid transporter